MTENKRFECDKGSRIIIDNETKLHYIMTLDWECSLVTKLLNRFAEENEQLKNKIDCHILLTDQERQKANNFIKGIEKENEQLKQQNTELIAKIDLLERVIDGDVE